ncbi:hypothetical protein PRJ_1454 [Pseudomonas sp. XWY-1]|nr:hypothetical protein PRJ_1454 [Pseudomonas sp. XWY-1]
MCLPEALDFAFTGPFAGKPAPTGCPRLKVVQKPVGAGSPAKGPAHL